ncbi:MAG: LysR family transcriptional regulator [Pseudomonadota bacterium]
MNLNALQTFLTIIEAGSLIRASERLNVTQSTVTARLQSLEDELGQSLVNRHKSGVTLTGSGERLRRYAETMIELWRQARQETALPNTVQSVCNIGCHADLWPNMAQTLFDQIRQTQSSVGLSVWHGGQNELTSWLNSGLSDVVLTYWPATQPRQTALALPPDELILVSTRADAPLKFDPGYFYVEAGQEFGRKHAAAFSDAAAAKINFGSATLGIEHILVHGGSAYLPRRMVQRLMDDGKLFHLIEAPAFERPAYLLYNTTAVEAWPWFHEAIEAAFGAQVASKIRQ